MLGAGLKMSRERSCQGKREASVTFEFVTLILEEANEELLGS